MSVTTRTRENIEPGSAARLPAPARVRPTAGPRGGADAGRRDRIPGLDGLRAVAVVGVIAYHIDPRWLPGGFLGVDVFFVVSGFIITTVLLRELRRRRRISLPAFWARRARRLLPALVAVVVTSVVAARVVQPDLLVGIGRQVLGAATFSSNWLEIAAGGSYFDATAPVLFQTFWSLAVEEQFYLVWPVLLVLLLVLVPSARARAWITLAGAATSAILMAVLYDPAVDPTRVYYGTDTHAFGLLLGAAAALYGSTGARLLTRRVSRWAAPVAAGGLVALMGTMHDDSPWAFRGGILLGSVLALVLVARCADVTGEARRTVGIRVLEARPVAWVGVRSYGLYLWHWPVILLVGAVVGAQPGTVAWWRGTVAALVLTFVLSAVSYRWIETPVRRDGFGGTVARVRGSVGPLARHPASARTALGAVVAAGLVAAVVVATAPRVSEAQLAVEQGAASIAAAEQQGEDDGAGTKDAKDADTKDADAKDPEEKDAGKAAEETAPQGAAVSGDQISAFGDSVLSGAAPAVLETFPGIDLDAKPIRKWLDVPALVEAADAKGDLRDVVILQFGTNGGFQFDGSHDALDKVLDVIGPDRKVVLVTSVGISSWVPDANQTLEDVAAAHDNVVVAEWYDAVHDQPGLLHSDQTHPNMDGIFVYAKVLKEALAELG